MNTSLLLTAFGLAMLTLVSTSPWVEVPLDDDDEERLDWVVYPLEDDEDEVVPTARGWVWDEGQACWWRSRNPSLVPKSVSSLTPSTLCSANYHRTFRQIPPPSISWIDWTVNQLSSLGVKLEQTFIVKK